MFDEYVATKMTQADKRGFQPGTMSSREYHADRRGQGLPPVPPRTREEIRNAQHNLAAMALDKPDPAGWLRETLDMLGIRMKR